MKAGCSDQAFIAVFRELQSTALVAKRLGVDDRNVRRRRNYIEKRYNIVLPLSDARPAYNRADIDQERAVYKLSVVDGEVLIASDLHIWPGTLTTMQRAFLHFVKQRKPSAVILNGDVFDGSRVSRHPSIGWEHKPTVRQEIEAVRDYLADLTIASGNALRIWPAGNHDLRYESRIAAALPEMEGVAGMHLKDHFPEWVPCWRVDINDDVVVKHRFRGGEHADWNNVVHAGKTIVTGHDHRCGVTPYRDYRGLRFGVRCGYLAESALDPQFVHYLEANEPNWHPAFCLLTFRAGELMWPELITRHQENSVCFRGELIDV